ncbi:Uncharacterised protein at_DN2450 [Pycnogonum litorale]
MSVDDFILAFIRFSNRYGIPREVYTDNAKTFLASAKLLKSLITSNEFQESFKTHKIQFKTVPVYASWYAGSWERLIKVFKQAFYKTIGRRIIPYHNFITTVSDIQLVINNRPLTYCTRSNDLDVVTPNHLMSPGVNFPNLILSEERVCNIWDQGSEEHRLALLNSLESRDLHLSRFKELWHDSYLLSLREQHKNSFDPNRNSRKCHPFLKEGAVVLLKHPFKSKQYWSLVKITALFPGADNEIRVAKIQRSDGTQTTSAINNLYPLELETIWNDEIEDHTSIQDQTNYQPNNSSYEDSSSPEDEPTDNSARPQRKAALSFKQKFKNWLSKDLI